MTRESAGGATGKFFRYLSHSFEVLGGGESLPRSGKAKVTSVRQKAMPVTLTEEEVKTLTALFEKMELKPQGDTPEQLQRWLQDRFLTATTVGVIDPEGEDDGKRECKPAATTGLVNQHFKLSVTFAGDESIKGTCKYDLWKYEVECLVKEGVCTDEVVK